MILAAHAKLVLASDIEGIAVNGRIAERFAVPPHRLFGDLGKRDPFDPSRSAGEVLADELRLEADSIENLRAAIRLVRGDAHLGHHLENALVDRLDIPLDDFLLV